MPSVAEFVQDEATETISVKNGRGASFDIEITYRPSQMTADRTDVMVRRADDGDTFAFLRLFEEVVIEWDLEGPLYADVLVVDDNGNPILTADGNEMFERKTIVEQGRVIPIDVEVLKYMVASTLNGIWRELVQKQSGPNPKTSRGLRRH